MTLISRPFVGLICLIAVLYLFILTPILVNGLTDGTCYSNETLELFTFTPGQYEPEPDGKPLRPERCSGLCADAEYPLAGVVSSVYCLCADETTISTLESLVPLTPSECNSTSVEGNLQVYKGEILHAVTGLTMNVTPTSVGYTQEVVNFTISIKTGVDVQFSFDFGDGSARTEWNSSRKYSHIYEGSGYFKVKLFARQPAKPERLVVVNSKVIQIVDRLESIDIEFHCFPVIEPDEDSGCNVTVLAGQDLNATVDFGDSTELLEFTIPDTRFNPFGPLIADSANMSYEEAPHGLYILSDSAKSYSSNSNIRALEGYSTLGGDLELIVYRPWCGNNTPCSLGVVSCSPPKVFCLRDKNCIDPGTKVDGGGDSSKKKLTADPSVQVPSPDSCRSHIDLFPEYKVARRVKVTVTRNYFYYHLSKSRDFRIGDLIALRLFDAKLALVATEPSSTSNLDLIYSSTVPLERGTPTIIGYESLKPMNSKKLLVRVITYENSEFYLPHPYADNGNYTVKLVLTSPWLENVKNFTYEAKIAVQTPIDQIRLRVVPPNAVVGQKVSATIRINGGSDVKLTWDFGDTYKTTKKVDFVKTGQKFLESHEYTIPGVYRINVGASNLQNKYTTGQTITIQYPITSDWKLASSSPQLLPGE